MKAMYRVILCVLLFVFTGIALPLVNKLPAAELPKVDERTVPYPSSIYKFPSFRDRLKPDPLLASGKIALNVRDFVRLVREKNEQISYQDAEWAISREAVKGAKAIFEPALIGSYQYSDDMRRNTVQEMVMQGFAPLWWDRGNSYQAAVEGLVPTGGKLRFGYTRRDFKNSIDDRYGVDGEYQTTVGVTLTQPLLKGAGIKVTNAGLQVAKADSEIAFQTYRGQMMKIIAEAISNYWDLYPNSLKSPPQ